MVVFRAQAFRINTRPCAECVKKKMLWSVSTEKAFKALMCFVCEWPVDLVVNSVLPIVASIHRAGLPPKAAPIVPHTDPTLLLLTLNQWSEVARWLACFCHCNEAKLRPEVSTVRFPHTHILTLHAEASPSLKCSYTLPPTFNANLPLFSSNSGRGKKHAAWVCLNALRLSIFNPSFLPPSQLFFFFLSLS